MPLGGVPPSANFNGRVVCSRRPLRRPSGAGGFESAGREAQLRRLVAWKIWAESPPVNGWSFDHDALDYGVSLGVKDV